MVHTDSHCKKKTQQILKALHCSNRFHLCLHQHAHATCYVHTSTFMHLKNGRSVVSKYRLNHEAEGSK